MKRKSDVLFLLQYFYPEYISSATLPLDTAEAIVKEGYSVGVICGYPKEYNLKNNVPKNELYNGISIKRLRYFQRERFNFLGRLINNFSFTFSALLKITELKNYKIIFVYSNPPVLPIVATLANKLYGVKVVFVSYDIYPEIAEVTKVISPKSFISKLMKLLNLFIYKRVYKVVALSNEMKKFLLIHRPFLSEDQIEVIPNWYDDNGEVKPKQEVKNKLFNHIIDENSLIVSYFGNMGTGQDIETIVEAARFLRESQNIKFLFAGHGNKLSLLKKTVKEEKLTNVYIYDFLHGEDFQDALAISDCFIVSLAEGVTGLAVPSKTYGYMKAGRPIIAIMDEDSDIVRDLKEFNAGYNVQPGETSKLIEIINELYKNVKKRKILGMNCRNLFLEKYTKNHCTQKYVELVRNILED